MGGKTGAKQIALQLAAQRGCPLGDGVHYITRDIPRSLLVQTYIFLSHLFKSSLTSSGKVVAAVDAWPPVPSADQGIFCSFRQAH